MRSDNTGLKFSTALLIDTSDRWPPLKIARIAAPEAPVEPVNY